MLILSALDKALITRRETRLDQQSSMGKTGLEMMPNDLMEGNRTLVGRSVFKTVEGRRTSLVGSTPTPFRQTLCLQVEIAKR